METHTRQDHQQEKSFQNGFLWRDAPPGPDVLVPTNARGLDAFDFHVEVTHLRLEARVAGLDDVRFTA